MKEQMEEKVIKILMKQGFDETDKIQERQEELLKLIKKIG